MRCTSYSLSVCSGQTEHQHATDRSHSQGVPESRNVPDSRSPGRQDRGQSTLLATEQQQTDAVESGHPLQGPAAVSGAAARSAGAVLRLPESKPRAIPDPSFTIDDPAAGVPRRGPHHGGEPREGGAGGSHGALRAGAGQRHSQEGTVLQGGGTWFQERAGPGHGETRNDKQWA